MVGKPRRTWIYASIVCIALNTNTIVHELHRPGWGWFALGIAGLLAGIWALVGFSARYRQRMRDYRTAKRIAADYRYRYPTTGMTLNPDVTVTPLSTTPTQPAMPPARALPTSPGSTRAGGQPES